MESVGESGKKNGETSKRICMLVSRLDQVGGAEMQVARLARALARLQAEVVICAPYKKGTLQDDGKIHYLRIPICLSFSRYLGGLAYLVLSVLCLWHARRRYDLIHAHGLNAVAQAAIIVGGLLGKPVIAQAHGAGETGDLSQLRRSWMATLRRRLLARADRYVAVSGEIRMEMRGCDLDDHRIVCLPNGVDRDVFHPFAGDRYALRRQLGLSGDDKVVTFVGRLHPIKRVDLLIRAFHCSKTSVREARLVIVGDGPLRSALERLSIELGLGHDVIFTGMRQNVVEYLHASDLFVLPSEIEGMSVALLEAMACGVPVLVSDCVGNRDLVIDNVDGILFPRGSDDDLAQQMMRLLIDTAYAQRLGRKAAEKAEAAFCLESVAARYLDLYDAVLGRNTVMVAKPSMNRC